MNIDILDLVGDYNEILFKIKKELKSKDNYGNICICGQCESFEFLEEEKDSPYSNHLNLCLNCGGLIIE